MDEKSIKLTQTGTLLIRNIAMCFDEYMANKGRKKPFKNYLVS